MKELITLSEIARSSPQATSRHLPMASLVIRHTLFLCRTCSDIDTFLEPLDDTICAVIIPSISSQNAPNDVMRDLFALPCCYEGLNILNPISDSSNQSSFFLSVTDPLVNLIISQSDSLLRDSHYNQMEIKK